MTVGSPATRSAPSVLFIAIVAMLSSCATVPPPATSASATAASVPVGALASSATSATVAGAPAAATPTGAARPPGSAAPATPGAPRPFAEIIKDAKEQPGLFTLWTKDEKVWIEIKPEQFDQLYYLQSNLSRGVMGEMAVSTARAMLRGNIITFKKIGNNVQLIARNFSNYARPATPIAIATAEGTSDSLLSAAPLASAPHPEKKTVLVEANALLLGDIPMITYTLDNVYRAGYSLDRANSYFSETSARDDATTFDVTAHFSVPKLPVAPPTGAMPPSAAQPRAIGGVPDARSFFVGLFYTLSKLPDEPMRPRAADGRIGHFNQQQFMFGEKDATDARRYVVNRWRLEKSDSNAALSPPKKPITYWLDKNIPLEYRATVKAGVLEWNKAFEKLGFKDAIRVEQQPDDAKWSTNDTGRASVRWYVDQSDGALAVGPSRVDPRTGEILDADITIGNGWVTLPRWRGRYQSPRPMPSPSAMTDAVADHGFLPLHRSSTLPRDILVSGGGSSGFEPGAHLCSYSQTAMEEASFALDLMSMRAQSAGTLDPVEVERIVHAQLKGVVTHEVGHTLGLRHNFRASTVYTQAQLSDPAFTRVNGLGGSVMDYEAYNIALDSEAQGEYVRNAIGPYDYWAIEYAYRELPAANEKDELARIAARSTEPLLAYATDEEVDGDGDGMDPTVNHRDIGADPLEFAHRRVLLSRELFNRLQTRPLPVGENYDTLTRNFQSGLAQIRLALGIAAKYVGGVVYLRDQAGSDRAPLTPVPADKQRAALKLIAENLFSVNGFNLKPEFASRLVENALDRGHTPPTDRSLDATLLALQIQTLDRLLSTKVADRIENARSKLVTPTSALTLDELYSTVTQAIWSDGPGSGEPTSARRALQREHVRRIAAAITKPGVGTASGDARALHRLTAKTLLAKAQAGKGNTRLSAQSRAHLDEVADTLDAALKAQATRVVG